MIKIERMDISEIDFAHHLTEEENWGVSLEELITLHSFSPNSLFVAKKDDSGELIGIAIVVPYNTFSFIGNLIVLKEYRGQGIGTQLMKHAMNYVEDLGIPTIMLDAVESAIPLYERLGFRKCCKSFRLGGIIKTQNNDNNHKFVRLMNSDDLSDIFKLDLNHFNADRSALLTDNFNAFPELCKVIDRNGKITSFIMGLRRPGNIKLGPWAVDDKEVNPQVLMESYSLENSEIRIGILEIHKEALKIAKKCGLNITSYSIRMVFGENVSISPGLYTIGGPDRG